MPRIALLCLAAALGLAVPASAGPAAPAEELLPDLDQLAPKELEIHAVATGKGLRFRLAFRTAVDNVGSGPLVIRGRRESRGNPYMSASQRVLLSNGRFRTYRNVGILRYVRSETHSHWHFLPFAGYELRSADGFYGLLRGRKTGFCLSDRHEAMPGARSPGKPKEPVFTGFCGPLRPDLLTVLQGESVGYRDIYPGHLEGQYVDVTDLEPGRYVLVNRVNASGALHESDYENNAASLLVQLAWPGGREQPPTVQVLSVCERRADCGASRATAQVMLPGR